MKKQKSASKIFIASFLVGLTAIFSTQFAFAQCGNYFKTSYRKILPDFSNYQVEDWTGDGKADFWKFQLNPNTSTQNIVIYPNNGNGEFDWDNPFVSRTMIPVIRENLDFYELIDFNNDGKKDIFFSQGANLHTVFLNNGANSFTALASNTFNDEPNSVYVKSVGFIDLNNDNTLDWIRINNIPNQQMVNIRLGNANGTFGARTDIFTVDSSVVSLIGDFNGDGRKDIARGNGGSIGVRLNNGNGTFSNEIGTSGFRTGNATVKDVDGDGKEDIVVTEITSVSGFYTRYLHIFRGSGSGGFARTQTPVYQFCCGNEQTYAVNLKVADFNGDNSPDILELNRNFYSIHLNNGAGNFSRIDYKNYLGEPQDLLFAQFNGDNKTDLFIKSNSSTYLKNMFDERIILIKYNHCNPAGETKRANFDGNKLADLVVRNSNTGAWSSLNSNSGFWSVPTIFTWNSGNSGDVPALGDYDGDEKTDYAVFSSNGTWFIRRSSDSSTLTFPFGLAGDIPVPGDYDGGGKTDIAVFRPSDGNWYFWFTETQQFSAVHFGANGDQPVAQDYDGDGKTDVAVFRSSGGDWYYLRSSDQNFVGIHWGISTDKPVPADYDGDGNTDIAVFRNGNWYLLRSSNNSCVYFNWGTTGDIPIPLYANEESATPVIYRPSNFTWYFYTNLPYYSALTFGNNQSVPIYFGLPSN